MGKNAFKEDAGASLSKQDLRRIMGQARASRDKADSALRSRLARSHLMASSMWKDARCVGLYMPLGAEADCQDLASAGWRAGKKIYLPRIVDLDARRMEFAVFENGAVLVPGPYKIPEPVSRPEAEPPLDILLVPGLAFDMRGYRLGYGGGYYDRYLAAHPAFSGHLCGFCHHFQVIDDLPSDPWDIRLHWLCTDKGLFCLAPTR